MTTVNRKEPFLLGFGDIVTLTISLWVTLIIRYQDIPSPELWHLHLVPFAVVFVVSVFAFYSAGLYGRHHTVVRRTILPGIVIKTQIVNTLIAVLLFYFVPSFTVTPKLNLFLYFVISSIAITVWRMLALPLLRLQKKQRAIVIGSGQELQEIVHEMNKGSRSAIEAITVFDISNPTTSDISKTIKENIKEQKISHVVLDLHNEKIKNLLPELYTTLFVKVTCIDIYEFYEQLFDRIPLSCMTYEWVLEHIHPTASIMYIIAKRCIDLFLSTIVGIVTIILYPFVVVAIKLEDGGPVFIFQDRIGKNGQTIKVAKFRSMTSSDSGKWLVKGDNRVTKVGLFLRKSRIDELPQAWSVFKGDMSLIGPRPDITGLVEHLKQQIPYYLTRTVVVPGLSGWAQVNQDKPPQSVEETKLRLSYDLYYIKNRSLMIDLQIVLRTIRTLLSRAGM